MQYNVNSTSLERSSVTLSSLQFWSIPSVQITANIARKPVPGTSRLWKCVSHHPWPSHVTDEGTQKGLSSDLQWRFRWISRKNSSSLNHCTHPAWFQGQFSHQSYLPQEFNFRITISECPWTRSSAAFCEFRPLFGPQASPLRWEADIPAGQQGGCHMRWTHWSRCSSGPSSCRWR